MRGRLEAGLPAPGRPGRARTGGRRRWPPGWFAAAEGADLSVAGAREPSPRAASEPDEAHEAHAPGPLAPERRLARGQVVPGPWRPGPADRAGDARLPASRPRAALAAWPVRDVLLPFALTRGLLTLVGVLAMALFPFGPFPGAWNGWERPWLDTWARWDGRWYLSVVRDGYSYVPGEQSNVAFSPLYPLLMRVVGVPFGGTDTGWLVAGLVVSNAAFLVALLGLVALARLDFDEPTARRTALYLAVFPTSLFLSAVYADSLYLALAVWAFYAARRRTWWLAGALAALATLARPHGVLIGVPLLVEYLAQRRFHLQAVRPTVLALALIPLALAAWIAYLWQLTGDPLAFVSAQAGWGRGFTPPWETVARFFAEPLVPHGTLAGWDHSLLDLAFVGLFVAVAVASWRLLRRGYAVYATLVVLAMLSSGSLAAAPRYGLAIFPTFLLLALAGRQPWFHQAYLVGASMFAALFMALFSVGYWVA